MWRSLVVILDELNQPFRGRARLNSMEGIKIMPDWVHLLEPRDFVALDTVDFPTDKPAVTCQTTLLD